MYIYFVLRLLFFYDIIKETLIEPMSYLRSRIFMQILLEFRRNTDSEKV